MTTAVQATATQAIQPAEPMPAQVTWRQAISAVVSETHCTRRQARSAIRLVDHLIKRARKNAYEPVELSYSEMGNKSYWTLDDVMPHGQIAELGSAHDLIQQLLLDPARGELAFVHDELNDEHGDPSCRAIVSVSQVSLN